MIKIGFITLGCKVNIYESNALKNELEAKGYTTCEADESCDVFIVNTCSVTNQADAKSRKMIHKVIKMNPEAIVCVMGCYAQTNKEALSIDGVDILVGNGNKKSIVKQIEMKLKEKNSPKYTNVLDILNTHEYEALDVTTFDHTRAFVKIEDGCENFCTYCIIPYARGPIRCKEADKVIEELIRITNMGYEEVVLAGIHTGRYKDGTTNLSALIKRILKEVPLLKRLRLSSIEINEVDDEFIEIMKNSKVIANHLHLPLQAGSDVVLSKMERHYNKAFFYERVLAIRKARPDISLTTDVIVGFPYETDEEFEIGKAFMEEIHFSKLHVFPYSMRKGTKAETMPQVAECKKKERTVELLELSEKLEKEYAMKFIGSTQEVIVEQKVDEKYMVGHTSNYLSIYLPLDISKISKMIDVKIIEFNGLKLIGKIVTK